MERVVHVHADRGPLSVALVVLKGALVLAGLWLVIRSVLRGEAGEALLLGLVMVGGGAVFGGYDLLRLLDPAPQLTLSPQGFRNNRAPVPVLVPWDQIRALGYRGGGQSMGWSLELFLVGNGSMVVPAGDLKVKPKELVRLVQDFAPHVVVDERFRLWLGSGRTPT